MLKRFSIHFALIILFAFAQVGAITHEISHFSDYKQSQQDSSQQDPSKQDKNTHGEQCKQCISYAEVAGGLVGEPFVSPVINNHFVAEAHYNFSSQSFLNTPYSARAPPQTS